VTSVSGGRPRQVAVAAAGVLAVIAALLPWVSSPLGFRQLQARGVDGGYGRLALVLGVLVLLDAALTVLRRRALLGPWLLAAVAAGLGVVAALGWADARAVLDREVPGVGVHPGQRGPGLVVLWFSVAAVAMGAAAALRDRTSAPGARPAEGHRADDE
jgi:hypothetical protein